LHANNWIFDRSGMVFIWISFSRF